MTHPYSIFIWQPERHGGSWFEPIQAYTQEYAIYVANLIHQDTRYGLIIAAYPNKETVEKIEKYIARYKE